MAARQDSKPTKAIVGVFGFMDDLLHAIEAVKSTKLDYRVYSPFASHEIEHATSHTRSPIRFITAVGAMTGISFGFFIAIWMSLDYPLRVSAKDIISIPGFVVIGYECTILFGAIATLLSMFHFCRLPDIFRKFGFDGRFTDNKFGLVVGCSAEQAREIESSLRKLGAEEVEVRDAL